ncbi:multicopper oxidase family protein [Paenibacillus sp. MMO-177]|uniref:multicopper oxidase family protein n=1 Tax=Paenibacillus sp. MMO-177 TaxID=3081289 RepID=UPI0030166553
MKQTCFVPLFLALLLTGCSGQQAASQQVPTGNPTVKNRSYQVLETAKGDTADDILTTKKLRSLPALPETDSIKKTGKVREVHLEAKTAKWEVVSGVTTEAITFNGTVPGPLIRAKEGDTIRVILKNSLKKETSIHWHGLHVPNKMDGVPSFTQHAIKPGETFTYEFTANHAGTYMYHSHFNSIEQIDKGLYGLLIIDPQNEIVKHDREYSYIIGGWNIPDQKNGGKTEDEKDSMAGMSKGSPSPLKRKGDVSHMMKQGLKTKSMQGMTPGEKMEMPGKEEEAGSTVMGMDYNYWTMNGKSFPDTQPLEVKQGEWVRIRLANISNGIHPMHLHGHDFRIIAKDGHPLPTPQVVSTVTLNPGETYDIDFIADNPGEWVFHCHELHHTTNADVEPGGLLTLVKYVK